MKKRILLYADEGKILTDGVHYTESSMLEIGRSEDDFYEIDKSEYEAIMKAKEEEELKEIES